MCSSPILEHFILIGLSIQATKLVLIIKHLRLVLLLLGLAFFCSPACVFLPNQRVNSLI